MKSLSSITGYYKKVMMALSMLIVLFVWDNAFCGQAGNDFAQKSEIRSQKSCEEMFECFDDFIVYLKDAPESVYSDGQGTGKKDKILLCNVAVELNLGMELTKKRAELRKIIYKTLKELSELPNIRSGIKEAIKIRLNNFMDAEIIKKVYFIKFVML